MMTQNNSIWSELLIVHDFLQIKQKIKLLDTHSTLPLIVFADIENNVYLYDIIQKNPIRIFNIRSYFTEQMTLKDLRFFCCNDKKFITNYELTEIKKVKGIQFNSRNNMIILTFERNIVFYSFVTQNIVRMITPNELEQKLPVKCEVFNYAYLLILNNEGNLILWDLIDWVLVKTINKSLFGKAISAFHVAADSQESRFTLLSTVAGSLFSVDFLKKEPVKKNLEGDNRNKHECAVNTIDFNPSNNYHASCSKNSLYVSDYKNPALSFRLPNFQYYKSQKINGMFSNINSVFPKHTYFIYGKSPALSAVEMNLDLLKNKKIDPKDAKNLIFYTFDLDHSGLPKFNEKQFKIYTAKTLNNSTDYIVLGTNKGVVILKYNDYYKPDIILCYKLIELNDSEKLFAYMTSSGNNLYELSMNLPFRSANKDKKDLQPKFTSIIPAIFDGKIDTLSKKIKVEFSFDGNFMSIVNCFNQSYAVYSMQLSSELRFIPTILKSGKGIDVVWCNYDNYFAVVSNSENTLPASKIAVLGGMHDSKKMVKCCFSLSVYKININLKSEAKKMYDVQTIYSLNDFASHKVFGGHYLCVYETFEKINANEIGIKDNLKNVSYMLHGNTGLFFYNWHEKNKLNYFLSEEPMQIVCSSDLEWMVIVYEKKYDLLRLNISSSNLELKSSHHYSILDAYLYENFILFFLTDKGLFFHILNEEGGSANKIRNASEENVNLHLKISKKIKEKSRIYNKKLFNHKILGVFKNVIALTDSFNNTNITKLDHPLFEIIDLIISRKFSHIPNKLELLEKKYVSKVVAIFDYYFSLENEEAIKGILGKNTDIADSLQLFRHVDFLKKDLINNPNPYSKSQLERLIKSTLVKATENANENKIAEIYEFCSENNLVHNILCSKLIDCNLFLKSLLTNNRNFESFVFNENYKIDESMGEKILGKAFERLNNKTF